MLRKVPVPLAPPNVQREGAAPVVGEWTAPAQTERFISADWVQVPCGGPTATVEFASLQGEARLAPQLRVEVPPSGSDPGEVVFLWPEPPLLDDPSVGPAFPLETTAALPVTLTPTDGVADI